MTELVSYCTECDAPPGDCTHTGPRYLDPIEYIPVKMADGTTAYAIPAHERERWNNGSGYTTEGTAPTTPQAPPDTLDEIITRLERHMFVTADLRTKIADAHQVSPYQATQLSRDIDRRIDHLHNPAGVLIAGLRQIVSYDT